jgi:hypothetical protein
VVSVFAYRCVYLFAALLVLIVLVPFLEDSERGRIALNAINILILFAAAVAVSNSRVFFALALARVRRSPSRSRPSRWNRS